MLQVTVVAGDYRRLVSVRDAHTVGDLRTEAARSDKFPRALAGVPASVNGQVVDDAEFVVSLHAKEVHFVRPEGPPIKKAKAETNIKVEYTDEFVVKVEDSTDTHVSAQCLWAPLPT